LLGIQESEQVLLVGVGTGSDLDYLPKNAHYKAIDITPSMLRQCEKKVEQLDLDMECTVMNAQRLNYPDNSFDAVILHLILAVVPDPIACISEVQRVLKPGGRVAIYDKFLDDDAEPNCCRKCTNFFTDCVFTNINLRLGDVLQDTEFAITQTEGIEGLADIYKLITLRNNKVANDLEEEDSAVRTVEMKLEI
jgi:ubiquinone/menaquinone biosynthesis C-methylase UbiE